MNSSKQQKQGANSAMSTRSETRQRQYVDHTYRDCSRFLERGGQITDHKKSLNNFPKKLHLMLSNQELSYIITWMPHGRCWKVLDKELLIEEGNPTYFSQTKFESFTRQLSSWGFKRLHRPGRDQGCYYHEWFLRGLPRLTELMRRVESNQGKPLPCPEDEPDFYSITRSYPLPSEDEKVDGTLARVEAPTFVATSQSVPSNSSTHGWNTNETSPGITSASEGATVVATSLPRTSNAFERSTRRELMSGGVSDQTVANSSSMASSPSSIPGGINNSASAATFATQSSGVVYHDLQVQSYYQGETNRPQHPQQELSAQSSIPFQAPSGESTSYLSHQYQAQASASNNSFHQQPHLSVYQMDSLYFGYPENDVSTTLAASSSDRYAQGNNSGSNTSTYASEEVIPPPNPQPYYEPEQAGLERQNDDTEANNGGHDGEISNSVTRFLEHFELQEQQQHGGLETNNEGQEDGSSSNGVNKFIENFEF